MSCACTAQRVNGCKFWQILAKRGKFAPLLHQWPKLMDTFVCIQGQNSVAAPLQLWGSARYIGK